MPKIYEKGYAQKGRSITGNSQQGEGYAHLKGRAMPKIKEKGYDQNLKQTLKKKI